LAVGQLLKMKYIPPYILDKIERREKKKREELQKRLRLPLPLPLQPEINEEKKEKEDYIIIDMGG
jgi:hypothetical protein